MARRDEKCRKSPAISWLPPARSSFHTVCKNYAPRSRLNGISHLQRAEVSGEYPLPTPEQPFSMHKKG
jgi:hypothetical protein